MSMPPQIAEIRRDMCRAAGCSHPDQSGDPCARCAAAGWGPVDCRPTEMPSLPKMAASAVKAAASEIAARASGVSPPSAEEHGRRLAICGACSHLSADGDRCAKCGCFIRLKTGLATQKCPDDRW